MRAAKLGRGLVMASVLVACAAACGGGGEPLVIEQSPPPPAPPSPTSATPSVVAACSPVQTVAPYDPADRDAQHVDVASRPPLSSYPSVPPASGPHDPVPFPAGVYAQPVDWARAIHSLEHGAVVVWLAPDADPGLAASVRSFVQADPTHTIVAPYDYPEQGEAGRLPEGTQMALVAWRRLQLCSQPDVEAVRAFSSAYRAPPLGDGQYLGEAPEPGVPI